MTQLLAQCALGNQSAFADLYQQTSPKLFGIAVRILKRTDLAEEVLQDSFVNIWNHASEYTTHKSIPMTWMASIVRNRALDLLRRLPLEELRYEDDAFIDTVESNTPGPLQQLLRSHEGSALARCLQVLDAPQRQSIMLAFYHGLSHAELAKHLRQPLGTIKSWIRRGLQGLKRCLET